MPARNKRKVKDDNKANATKGKTEAAKPEVKSGKVAKRESKTASVAKPKSAAATDKVLYSHWLMKSEPESRFEDGVDVKFGIEDLEASPDQTAPWDGVRNYQVLIHNVLRQNL